jgi:polyhydroxyalkanoate synthase
MVLPEVESQTIDAQLRAALASVTASMSPQSGLLAWIDWLSHLVAAPGRQLELVGLALEHASVMSKYIDLKLLNLQGAEQDSKQIGRDRRFADDDWKLWPFGLWQQGFLLSQQWWDKATSGIVGVEPHHQNMMHFAVRQWLDVFSPSNYLVTNPVALRRTVEQSGANLMRGLAYMLDDVDRILTGKAVAGVDDFIVGRDVATTTGKIVFRNRLLEIIQYVPVTEQVKPEPILLIPAWIMKYYILDLSVNNSLVKYLVENGYAVFCISWKNPGEAERDTGMDDYLESGFYAALDAINAIVPGGKVHATGYCLGGTLLSIAAAAMARDGDDRLASVSLFTAQTDFSEPGELSLFVDESQITLLEAQMAETGGLRGDQMAGAFQMLRSYDLLWSRMVNEYLLGERRPMNDLMAWNADTTRMPAKMHSQYLRRLFLRDDLSEGRFPVRGRSVSLGDLKLPVFCVGTESDHVAPWRSVYKLHYLTSAEITFVLTSGGHNAGIVSDPVNPRHNYRVRVRQVGEGYMDAQTWMGLAECKQGSWWPEWITWLQQHSGTPVSLPGIGAVEAGYVVLGDAPGEYVRER